VSSPWTFKDAANGAGPPDFVDRFRQLRKASLNNNSFPSRQSQKKNPPGKSSGLQGVVESFGK
jgi:hypothetical protein